MGCGCGKGREGTANVKERKREGSLGVSNSLGGRVVGRTGGSGEGYTQRINDYVQTLRKFGRR